MMTMYSNDVLNESSEKAYLQRLSQYETIISMMKDSPPPYPPTVATLSAFLEYKKSQNVAYNTLKAYVVAISYYCRKNNLEDITKEKMIVNLLKSYKKTLLGASCPYSVDAIKPDDLDKMSLQVKSNCFLDIRDLAMFSLQFECMLRVSEVIAIKIEHIHFEENFYSLYIPKTKTDQFGNGRTVMTYKSISLHSSYVWLQRYLKIRKNTNNQNLFITMSGFSVTSWDVRARIKEWTKKIGIDNSRFSTHSMRRGGAQTAARNGAFPSAIQHQGRWRSSCFLTYTQFDQVMAAENLNGKF